MSNRHHEDEVIGGAHCARIDLNKCNCGGDNVPGPHHAPWCHIMVVPRSRFLPPLREYTSAERKAMPVHKGVMEYFPDALAAIARVSFKGNEKHNPGEPLHWAREKSTDHEDCVARHMLTPDATDPDSGEAERTHAGWRILAAIQLAEEKRLLALGIKPLSGVTK